MGLGKKEFSFLFVSSLIILVLAPLVFSAVFKNSPVSAISEPVSVIPEPVPVGEQVVTESVLASQPVSEPIPTEEESINNVNSNPLLNCGDTITTNTVLTADLLNCPNDGIIIGANNLELDCNGHIIGGTGTGIGILAIGKQNIIVRNCIVKNFGNGIYFDSTNSSQMINNTFTNNLASGINVASSTNNTLKNNIISSNGPSEPAIVLYSASKNSIESNLVLNNNNWGFLIYGSSNNNTLKSNIISNNTGIGIKVGDGSGNLIFNNFFNNSMNALDTSNNSWNTSKTLGQNIIGGPYLGGNFWNDYTGNDMNGDGLGDTNLPYNSGGNIVNGDYAPLVKPSLCGTTITANTVLDSNLNCSGDGLIFGANNIELDCQGHVLTGDGSGSGILATGKQNIIVRNCIIQNFTTGINFSSTTSSQMINDTLLNNYYGAQIRFSSNNNTLQNITASSNIAYGLEFYSSSYNALQNITANNNNNGIYLFSSNNNILQNITANNNNNGLDLGYSNNFNILQNIQVSNNQVGLSVRTSSQNTLQNITAYSNTVGLELRFSSNNNTLQNIQVSSGTFGLILETSNFNTLQNITTSSNSYGIYQIFNSNFNTLSSSTLSSNGYGLYLFSSHNNTISNNFFNNTINAFDNSNNSWNTSKTLGQNIIGGPYLGGNFWHDYTGTDTDGDGLGDTNLPYNASGNIVNGGDYLPLVKSSINNTPVGTNVSVNLTSCNATLTFDNVTIGGNSICGTTSQGPPPSSGFGIVPSSPPLYYDINVSANFTGNVTVCLVYDESQVNGNESNLRLRQFSNGWNDITVLPVDTVNNIICGRTNHFSFFAVTEPVYLCGDVNNDGVHSVIDVVNMINVAFRGANQTGPAPLWVWDVNGDSVINIIDVVKIVNVAFRGANVTTELSCNEPVPNVQASTTITLQKTSGGFSASASIDRNVAGMQFDLSYDSSKVKISGVKTATRTSGMTITNTQISSGKNRIAIYSDNGEKFIKSGPGTLFTVQATGSDFSSLKLIPAVVDYKTSNGFSDVKVSYKFKTTTRLLA